MKFKGKQFKMMPKIKNNNKQHKNKNLYKFKKINNNFWKNKIRKYKIWKNKIWKNKIQKNKIQKINNLIILQKMSNKILIMIFSKI